MKPSSRDLLVLALFLAVCFGAAALGGLATASSVKSWYPSIAKPSWTPPAGVFGPVWTLLYASMAVAAWLVWRRAGVAGARTAFALFALQLALNVAWSFCFFGLKSPLLGLADIVPLLAAVVATALAFGRIAPLAGWILVPYALWVGFAAALNLAIVTLQP